MQKITHNVYIEITFTIYIIMDYRYNLKHVFVIEVRYILF